MIVTKDLFTLTPNRNESRGTKDLVDKQKIEWLKCKRSLLYYLENYVYIEDAVNQTVMRWQPHDHLLRLIDLVQGWYDTRPRQPRYIIIFKSKKVFVTTILSGIASWLTTFNGSTRGLEQSIGSREAVDFLAKSKFINEHHPPFLRLTALPNQDDLYGFPATGSRIVALPSSETAGRGADSSFVFLDEWEFHRNAVENYAAIQSSMARGGLLIGVSTVDKTDMETFAKGIWYGAKKGQNGFIPLFWGYFVVPYRNEETYQRDTASLPQWKREQEFARNEQEALSAPKSLGYFNHEILEKMLLECRDPLEERYGGKVRIFTPAITSRKFVFAIDPSEGQDDPSVGIISDGQTDEDVACFNGKISLDEQAKLALELYREYNEPLIAVERNASGLTLIEKLKNLGVKNWYYSDKEKRKEGWYTGSYGISRERILGEFAEQVHLRRKRIPIKDCVLEMFNFAWIDGKPQAVRGHHDDWVMCEAILGQVRKGVATGGGRIYSFQVFPKVQERRWM